MAERLIDWGKSTWKSTWKNVRGVVNTARTNYGEDPGVAFSSECESVHDCLQRLIKVHHFNLYGEEIVTTYYQLKNKEIIISIHGRHNCGKTSLINALLGDSLLPMSILNETGVKVKIEHDKTVHSGKCPNHPDICPNCPKLSICKPGVAHTEREEKFGCRDISEFLERANHEVRTSEDQKSGQHVQREFTLTTNVPMLASTQPGWKISMLDNPGFGESHQELMIDCTKTTLKTSSAYLVIMDVGQLGDKEDEDCLKLICDGDEGAFDDHGRVLIAVTKYDTMYQERKQKRKSEEYIKEVVQKNVNTATRRDISKDAIVPVCGKWALHVRLLQRDTTDEYSREQIIAGLKLAEVAFGQTENLRQMSPETLSIHMECVTKIAKLEERIKKMTSRCAYIWIDTMTSNYHRYIREGLAEVTPKLDEKEAELQATETFREELMQHYRSVSALRERVHKSRQEWSEVHHQILRSAINDVQGTKEGVRRLVQDFGARCRDMIEQGRESFGENELQRGVNQLLNAEVRPSLVVEMYNASDRFRNAVESENTAVQEMKNDIRGLMQATQLYIQPRPMCHNLPIIVEQAAVILEDGEREAADFAASDDFNVIWDKEKPTFEDLQQHLNIPPLQISLMKIIANGVRTLFHALFPGWVRHPIKTYRSYNNIADFMEQLQRLVDEAADRYLIDFERIVANFFFKRYCGAAESSLEEFERQLGSKLEKQKRNDDTVIEDLEKEVRNLAAEKAFLNTHQARITETAEKYKNSLRSEIIT